MDGDPRRRARRRARRGAPARVRRGRPSRDLDGTDAADKLAILARHGFGIDATTCDVQRIGVDWITPADVAAAHADGRRWRLVATAVRDACLCVEPVAVAPDHPFAGLHGPANAVSIVAERAGHLTLTGPGAGGDATASAILADLAHITAGTGASDARAAPPQPVSATPTIQPAQ